MDEYLESDKNYDEEMANKEYLKLFNKHSTEGIKIGIELGLEENLQLGFNQGYFEGTKRGFELGKQEFLDSKV